MRISLKKYSPNPGSAGSPWSIRVSPIYCPSIMDIKTGASIFTPQQKEEGLEIIMAQHGEHGANDFPGRGKGYATEVARKLIITGFKVTDQSFRPAMRAGSPDQVC